MNTDSYHSRAVPKEDCFVWIWLPGETEPVVAGKVQRVKGATERYAFAYRGAYREDQKSISIYDGDLPLRRGVFSPPADHGLASSLRDALPDNWGRRVIVNNLTGDKGRGIKEDAFDEMTFMLESGSDRIGALDFQKSSSEYIHRGNDEVTLQDLLTFADCVQAGKSVPVELDKAILHGSSIGGARPKALISDAGTGTGRPRKMIAKFSATNDPFGMVKGEFATMRMAADAGLNVAPVEIAQTLGRDVLLVERFDRDLLPGGKWARKAMVSALTWTQENELGSRHVAYTELAEFIRERFSNPEGNLREMFSRLTFNILCGNTDDHCRNHAAFWDGRSLTLTPAYDVAPQARGNYEARQAIAITPGNNASTLTNALQAAASFTISETDARKIINDQVEVIAENWPRVSEEAGITPDEALYFENRQILPHYAFDGYGPCPDLRPTNQKNMPAPDPF
ncbi:phosphatidylinositol kinase (plasmid) [Acetobacter persici]|uniref:Phosphatidylinositol kinase n=2 Tax=Acetobacter persici TaxID=1076596 RepID=A0A1U9LJX3_9PROT|nr:phosphatidylinositol kinase [Acetobacter persici]